MSNLSREEELLTFINSSPLMQSMLYDLNRMPEEMETGSPEWRQMMIIAAHVQAGIQHQKEGSAALVAQARADALEEAAVYLEAQATCPCNGDHGYCMENDPPRAYAEEIRALSTQPKDIQPSLEGVEPWIVAEYWSSPNPSQKVLCLSVGTENIAHDMKHESFIRLIYASPEDVGGGKP